MTVSSIILDLRGHNPIITNPNIVGLTIGCPTIDVIAITNICEWIEYKGGWTVIASHDIMVLADAYLEIAPLGFPVTLSHIAGAISYYLDRRSSGNLFTGCNFLI